jgi:hypothetical protein
LGGTINPKKVGGMGIDGFTFFNRYPIQVKQSENIGRNVNRIIVLKAIKDKPIDSIFKVSDL